MQGEGLAFRGVEEEREVSMENTHRMDSPRSPASLQNTPIVSEPLVPPMAGSGMVGGVSSASMTMQSFEASGAKGSELGFLQEKIERLLQDSHVKDAKLRTTALTISKLSEQIKAAATEIRAKSRALASLKEQLLAAEKREKATAAALISAEKTQLAFRLLTEEKDRLVRILAEEKEASLVRIARLNSKNNTLTQANSEHEKAVSSAETLERDNRSLRDKLRRCQRDADKLLAENDKLKALCEKTKAANERISQRLEQISQKRNEHLFEIALSDFGLPSAPTAQENEKLLLDITRIRAENPRFSLSSRHIFYLPSLKAEPRRSFGSPLLFTQLKQPLRRIIERPWTILRIWTRPHPPKSSNNLREFVRRRLVFEQSLAKQLSDSRIALTELVERAGIAKSFAGLALRESLLARSNEISAELEAQHARLEARRPKKY